MDTVDYLKDALEKDKKVYLSSSVFKEMYLSDPLITIWIDEKHLNITSDRDYRALSYYKKDSIKVTSIDDINIIERIYNSSIGYIHSNEEIINSLIELFSEKNLAK